MKNFIKADHIQAIQVDLSFLSKNVGSFIKKDEFLERLSTMGADVNHKLKDRPTLKYVKDMNFKVSERVQEISDNVGKDIEDIKAYNIKKDSEVADLDDAITKL